MKNISPQGSDICHQNLVFLLKRSLYGLKQVPRAWNTASAKFLAKFGSTQLKPDTCVFVNKNNMLAFYVDDIIVASKDLD